MLASILVPPKPTDGVAGFKGPLTSLDANRYNTTNLGSKIIFVNVLGICSINLAFKDNDAIF